MWTQRCDKYYVHIPERFTNAKGTTTIWNVPVITDWMILVNRPDIIPHDKKETCLLIIIAILDDSNFNTHTQNWKTKQRQRTGDWRQQDAESEVKNCASYNWSIRNN
jgi:hypothetical protein